jgi:hypothetical protein
VTFIHETLRYLTFASLRAAQQHAYAGAAHHSNNKFETWQSTQPIFYFFLFLLFFLYIYIFFCGGVCLTCLMPRRKSRRDLKNDAYVLDPPIDNNVPSYTSVCDSFRSRPNLPCRLSVRTAFSFLVLSYYYDPDKWWRIQPPDWDHSSVGILVCTLYGIKL